MLPRSVRVRETASDRMERHLQPPYSAVLYYPTQASAGWLAGTRSAAQRPEGGGRNEILAVFSHRALN